MTAEEIYRLLLHNSDFMYCTFKLTLASGKEEIVISTEGGSIYEMTKKNL